MECDHGLRVLGKHGARRLIDLRTALVRLAAADEAAELDRDQFTTALACPRADLESCLTDDGRFLDYRGPAGPAAGYLPLDFDSAADPRAAITAAVAVFRMLTVRFEIAAETMLLCYSGSKGAHLYAPSPAGASVGYRATAARFAQRLATEAGCEIMPDDAIYRRLQPLRGPNTRHGGTGRYKVRLEPAEFDLPLPEIIALAAGPRPFVWPQAMTSPRLRLLWRAVEAQQAAEIEAQQETETETEAETARIMRLTTDFLRNGAEIGSRARRCYSAARNLCEADVPIEAARGLLLPAARRCGLPTSEADRAIENAYTPTEGTAR